MLLDQKGRRGGEATADADMSEEEDDDCSSDMTGTIEHRALTAQRPPEEAGQSSVTPQPSPIPTSTTSMSAEVVAQIGSSLSHIAETQRQQQAALLALSQRGESEVAARTADVSMLANELKNMRLQAAEEKADILQEIRRSRSSQPPASTWVASQAAAE